MSPQNPNPKSPSEPRQGNPGGKPQGNANPSTNKPDERRDERKGGEHKSWSEPTRTGDGSTQPQRGGSPQPPRRPAESGLPRYDDRPDSRQDREGIHREENEGSAGQSTKSPEQRAKEAQDRSGSHRSGGSGGPPRYGDRESGDPRRSDVEGGESDSESGSEQQS
jgi:hypothetical protein